MIRKAVVALTILSAACAAGSRVRESPAREFQTPDGLRLTAPAGYEQRNVYLSSAPSIGMKRLLSE